MTDTKEMRDAFAADPKLAGFDKALATGELAQYQLYESLATEATWLGFQAAWTRKPAEQVAGAEVVAYANPMAFANFKAVRDGSVGPDHPKSHEWMWAMDHGGMVALYTHPAPEPDASKVVSVPVPWRERVGHYDIKYMTNKAKAAIESEFAEWRALAAERGWVK